MSAGRVVSSPRTHLHTAFSDGFSYPMQYVPNDASDDECSSETVKNKEDHATSPVDDGMLGGT